MKYVWTGLLLGIMVSGGMVIAQETPDAQCKSLANQFSENHDSLAIQDLERLRFCVNQALEHREQSKVGELLKGTIIDSQSSSESSLEDTKPPTAPKNLKITQ